MKTINDISITEVQRHDEKPRDERQFILGPKFYQWIGGQSIYLNYVLAFNFFCMVVSISYNI